VTALELILLSDSIIVWISRLSDDCKKLKQLLTLGVVWIYADEKTGQRWCLEYQKCKY
jgi:hypothetical protein